MIKMVSVNILNYNTYEKTRNCIRSCLGQEGIEYKIILVDNNSTDDSFERLREEFQDKIEYLQNKDNYGYAKGNNLGIKFCVKEGIRYTLILNSDISLVGKDLLRKLYDLISRNKTFGIIAPQIYNVTKNGLVLNQNDSLYLKLLRIFKILPENHTISENLCTVSEAQGSALLVDNDLFLKLGGFPEHFFMYGEESYFSKKILWTGKKIVWFKDEENYVLHHHDKSGNIPNWRLYLMGRNRALEYYENKGLAQIRWFLVFKLFEMFSVKGSKMKPYRSGIQKAKQLMKTHATAEKIYIDGKNAKQIEELP